VHVLEREQVPFELGVEHQAAVLNDNELVGLRLFFEDDLVLVNQPEFEAVEGVVEYVIREVA